MIRVQYIGTKDRKVDNVANTGVVWNGQGDVQQVPDEAWPKFKAHPEVWRLAPEVQPQEPPPPPPPPPRFALVKTLEGGGEQVIVLDDMEVDQLKAFAEAENLQYNRQLKDVNKIRAAIYAAATAAAPE